MLPAAMMPLRSIMPARAAEDAHLLGDRIGYRLFYPQQQFGKLIVQRLAVRHTLLNGGERGLRHAGVEVDFMNAQLDGAAEVGIANPGAAVQHQRQPVC